MAKVKRKAPEKKCPHCGKNNHTRKKECGHCGRTVVRMTRKKPAARTKRQSNGNPLGANGRRKNKKPAKTTGSGFIRELQAERKKLAARLQRRFP